MGFRLNRTYKLKFAGDMEGAEVAIRATPISTVLALREITDDTRAMVEHLVQYVTEWNLDGPDGKPLPLETDAILDGLEEAVLAEILLQWYRAATGISSPLDDGSTSGEPFPVESIPME